MARSTDTDRECLIDFANDSSALVYPLRIMACMYVQMYIYTRVCQHVEQRPGVSEYEGNRQ